MFGPGFFHRTGDSPAPRPSLRRLARHFGPFFRPYRGALAGGTLCVLIGLALGKMPPLITRFLVDRVLAPVAAAPWTEPLYRASLRRLGIAVAAMLGVSLLASWLMAVRTRVMRRAGAGLVLDIRLKVYAHLQKLSLRFYDARRTGDIMSRITGDVEAVERLFTGFGDRVLTDTLNLAVTAGILFAMNAKLALVALLPLPALIAAIRWFSRRARPLFRQVRDRMGGIHAKLQDNISGIRVIRAFNTEELESEQFARENREFYATQMKEADLSARAFPMIRFIEGLGAILVTAVGGWMLLRPDPEISLGDLFAFSAFVLQLYQPIGMLFHAYTHVLQAAAGGERIAEFLEEAPDIADRPGAIELPPARGEVVFEDVSFQYQDGIPVLDRVNLRARPGEIVALVGHSGAGKSTLINLIPRFYDPTAGRVLVDGHDVRDVRQDSLRRQIAIVLQDTFLFNGTVLENIRYGRRDATREEVAAAARAAFADEFIEQLPKGYDTEIGERGVKLSGGQKQRIAIARALLADRRILILDEATSMVDSRAETMIQQALAALMRGRTTFVIAHRLSTVRHADQILVIEGGRIVERGRHDELLARNGAYAAMCREQFRDTISA